MRLAAALAVFAVLAWQPAALRQLAGMLPAVQLEQAVKVTAVLGIRA